ncbi:MAG: hypothetical protein CMC96_01950 [Flavobacteriales bacterium]|nr:hypothetical protein [Flavobacteriales bacterium]
MDSQKKRKEITALIDNIKMHSDRLTESKNVPILELSVILSKITRLHEKTVILKYLLAKEQNHEEEEFGIEDIYKEKEHLEKEIPQIETSREEEKEENTPPVNKSLIDNQSVEKTIEEEPEVEEKEEAETETEEKASKVEVNEDDKPTHSPEESVEKKETQPKTEEIISSIEVEPKELPDLNEQYAEEEDPSLSEQLRKQPIADLMTAIGLNERYLYANELFDGDIEAFREVVKILNEFGHKEQALKYFKEQLIPTYEWDAKNDLVKALYLLVERRYQS